MPANVSIFTASIGAGHDVPAEILATALRERGANADIVDALDVAGPLVRAIVRGGSSLDSPVGRFGFEAAYLLGTRPPGLRQFG